MVVKRKYIQHSHVYFIDVNTGMYNSMAFFNTLSSVSQRTSMAHNYSFFLVCSCFFSAQIISKGVNSFHTSWPENQHLLDYLQKKNPNWHSPIR